MSNGSLIELPLFNHFSQSQLAQIEPLIEGCRAFADQTIFNQGDPAEYLYILLRGEVVVRYQAYDGPVITIAHVQPGGVFGWSAALGRPAYTSGAACSEEAEFYRIRGQALRDLCTDFPETGVILLERLASVIAERLTSTHSYVLHILTEGVEANTDCQRRVNANDGR